MELLSKEKTMKIIEQYLKQREKQNLIINNIKKKIRKRLMLIM